MSFTSILSIISSSSNTGSNHFTKSILCSAANIHINTSQYGKRGLSLTSGQSQSQKQGQGQAHIARTAFVTTPSVTSRSTFHKKHPQYHPQYHSSSSSSLQVSSIKETSA
eukprot:572981_1